MKIRVLNIVTHLNRGGLETMIMNYYRNIDRSKVQFDFLVQGEEKGDYEKEIEKLGGRIYRIRRINYFFPLEFEKEIYKFLLEHREYKIVHSHINALSKYVLRAAKKAKVPTRIAHSHIMIKNKNLKGLYKNIIKIGINKYATNKFACSKDAGKWLFGNKEFEIIKNAIDVEKFTFNTEERKIYRKELGFRDNEIIYFNIGRFVEQKNQLFIIDTFYQIQKKQNAKLVLIGDGNLKEKMINRVKELKIEDKVIFTGVRNDIDKLINAMDVFLFPSLFEGLGIVLIEAQSNGIKCFVSNKIPKEAIILDNVEIISLKCDKFEWANKILECKKLDRNKETYKVIDAGYDIKANAIKLQKMYMEL